MDHTPDHPDDAPENGEAATEPFEDMPPPESDSVQAAPPPPPPPPAGQAPPQRMPYPVAYPAPPKQPGGFRRGFGLGAGVALGVGLMATIAAVAAFALLAGLLALLVNGSGGSSSADDTSVETVWGDEDAETTIRSISVTGPILTHSGNTGGVGLFGLATYGYDVAADLDDLGKGDADAVVLELDTPGGTIAGSKAIADAVARYQDRTGRPVVAFVRGLSASGGMYAMAGADEIIADHGTLIGSIGVILGPLQQYKNVKALDGGLLGSGVTTDGGITSEYFTQGKGKDFGNPWRAITAEERRVITAGMNDEYRTFVETVSEGRGIAPATIRNELGAYIYAPQQAIDNGLVDERMGADEAYRRIAETAGGDPDDARIVAESSPGFLSALTGARTDTARPSSEQLELAAQVVRQSEVCTGSNEVLAVHAQVALCK